MTTGTALHPPESHGPSGRTLSVEIEPSYPLISAMIRFLREQRQFRQSLDLCRMGLECFPGEEGLHLLKALIHLDLGEITEGQREIEDLARSWSRRASDLTALSVHPRSTDWGPLQDWLFRLAQVLSQCPLRAEERAKADESAAPAEEPAGTSSLQAEKEGESKVLDTLTGWLSQLKGNGG